MRIMRFAVLLLSALACVSVAFATGQKEGAAPAGQLPTLELTMWDSSVPSTSSFPTPTTGLVDDYIFNKLRIRIKEARGNEGVSTAERFQLYVASNTMTDLVVIYGSEMEVKRKLYEGKMAWKTTPAIMEQNAPNVWRYYSPVVRKIFYKADEPYGGTYDAIYTTVTWDMYEPNYPVQGKIKWDNSSLKYRRVISVRDDILKKVRPESYTLDELRQQFVKNGKLTEEDIRRGGGYIDSVDEFVKLLRDIKALNIPDLIPALFHSSREMEWTVGRLEGAEPQVAFDWSKKQFFVPVHTPEIVAVWKKMNVLFREGLMPVDQFILKPELLQEKILSGNVAVTATYPTASMLNAAAEKAGKSYRYRNIYTNFTETSWWKGYVQNILPNALNLVVTNKGAIKDDATFKRVLQWVDFFASDEYFDVASWGPKEAGLYTVVDGKRRFKDKVLEQQSLFGYAPKGDEKGGAYYGLDFAVDWYRTRIPFALADDNPMHPKYQYWPLTPRADSYDSLLAYAATLSRNKTVWGWNYSVEQIPQRYYAPYTDLLQTFPRAREVDSLNGTVIRNEVFPKILASQTDAEFDAAVKQGQEAYDKLNGRELYRLRAEKLLEWFDKNPDFPRPDQFYPWGPKSETEAKAMVSRIK